MNIQQKSCITKWKEISSGDIKLFTAHIIAMGLVRKSNMEKYWSQDSYFNTIFGFYMSKNTFQFLLANIHMNDNSKYIPYGRQNHGPLFKIRPFQDMCKNRFKLVYSPECELSYDEGYCAYKGCLHFCLYNLQKPNKFHVKLFKVNEALSGYILAFEVYREKQSVSVADQAMPLDVTCTRTTKLVLGLLASVDLLHKGHHCYMDNYHSSLELFQELYDAGTVWKNRKGLPIAVSSAKLKKGESVFRRNDALLALKWADKHAIYMITTIHDAKMVDTGKRHFNNNERTGARFRVVHCFYYS